MAFDFSSSSRGVTGVNRWRTRVLPVWHPGRARWPCIRSSVGGGACASDPGSGNSGSITAVNTASTYCARRGRRRRQRFTPVSRCQVPALQPRWTTGALGPSARRTSRCEPLYPAEPASVRLSGTLRHGHPGRGRESWWPTREPDPEPAPLTMLESSCGVQAPRRGGDRRRHGRETDEA